MSVIVHNLHPETIVHFFHVRRRWRAFVDDCSLMIVPWWLFVDTVHFSEVAMFAPWCRNRQYSTPGVMCDNVVASFSELTHSSPTPPSASCRHRRTTVCSLPTCVHFESSDPSFVFSHQLEPQPDQSVTGAESLHSSYDICHLYSGHGYGYGHNHPYLKVGGVYGTVQVAYVTIIVGSIILVHSFRISIDPTVYQWTCHT